MESQKLTKDEFREYIENFWEWSPARSQELRFWLISIEDWVTAESFEIAKQRNSSPS